MTTTNPTMRAVLHDRYGTSSVLRSGGSRFRRSATTTYSSTSARPGWTAAPST